MAGIKTIIFLSISLALGFLLVILSCALFSNWLPLLVALLYVLAPLPNTICARCAGADDFSADYNSAYVDFGNWLTSTTVVSGIALPLVLAHAGVIRVAACIMSSLGGALVYGTMLTYAGFFSESGDDAF
ncbi:Leptin receptor gene-related protein [Ceraceosorus bombacis]|uniref:Leptin receptor gene-related protein n=2 Tax=Ceraceosorus TaxID=401624 RepID=A0A0P1BI69_9BASI|nr:vacuolar protein sorting 55 [Ceraceosorus guamensis]PWN42718.1 vacuolar protein sorting 55 [Ceraceosorus guamensis]CEH15361.1 Leptin receptor gene-related protein [Ceraceosorus bombacis]